MRKRSCFFTSAGDNSNLCNYIANNKEILNEFDFIVNYHDKNDDVYKWLGSYVTHMERGISTKFLALKRMYKTYHMEKYDSVFVFDDDAILRRGSYLTLRDLLTSYKLDLLSPVHSMNGKITYGELGYQRGEHIFRRINFIEMNFPIFSGEALGRYMEVYDGSLSGYGNDWWYLNVLGTDNCGVCDDVEVENPLNKDKSSCIDNYKSFEERKGEFVDLCRRKGMIFWEIKTMEYVKKQQ